MFTGKIPFLILLFCSISVSFLFGQNKKRYEVTVVRDSFNVPHIFGATDADVAYGIARAHAEDDFKAIQEMLLITRGRYGEYAGKNGAPLDFLIGLLDIRKKVEENYESEVSPGFKALCEAYCQGLNEHAALHQDEHIAKHFFPITPKDMMTGFVFTNCLLTAYPFAVQFILEGRIDEYRPGWYTGGSNAIAINPKRAADGQTFLAVNSHQPLEGIFSWYEVHVKSEEGWEMIGGLFPGGNLVFHGVTPNLGWACTLNYPDVTDVYKLELHPKDKTLYRFDGQWRKLEERKVKLKVKIGPVKIPITKKVYTSVYGPTLLTKYGGFATANVALYEMRSGEQLYRLNKAKNITDFRAAFKMQAQPTVNFVYADKEGNIYFLHNLKIPRRDPAFLWDKVLPGNTSRTLWNGFRPVDSLPQYLNPESGYLFNTNHTAFNATLAKENLSARNYPTHWGLQTTDNNRSLRLTELFSAAPNKISYQDFKRMKYDTNYPKGGVFQQSVARALALDPKKYPKIADALRVLNRWNRSTNPDNKDAALATVVFNDLVKKMKLGTFQLETGFEVPESLLVKSVADAQKYMLKEFGTIETPLGAVQRHIRGKKDLPIGGMPDILAATYVGWVKNPQGKKRLKIMGGESYILLAKWDKSGKIALESINAYGSSANPESPHYDDQMEKFVKQETKPITFDKATVLKQAVRVEKFISE